MKHSLQVTIFIVALFFIAQLVGLLTMNKHILVEVDEATGVVLIAHPDTVLGPAPVVENKSSSFVMIMLIVLLGTAVLLVLVKYKVYSVWKYWFLLAVWATIAVFLGVYIQNGWIAAALALALALLKVFKKGIWVHNLTEIFIYSGIVIILLPLFNMFSVLALLVIISIYDVIAVWKTKHMVSLANFQTKANLFAGLALPYHKPASAGTKAIHAHSSSHAAHHKSVNESGEKKHAVLGGGDIAFPLLFSGAVMESLIGFAGYGKAAALGLTGIVTVCVTASLFLLLYKAKEDKFYPAMPFLSLGCIIGYLIIRGIMLL